MTRDEIKAKIGIDFLTSNIENGEFSYVKALKEVTNVLLFINLKIFVLQAMSIFLEPKNLN